MGRHAKPQEEREALKMRYREARLAIASPENRRSRDAFARNDLKIDTNRYTSYENKGADPGIDELTAMYARVPSVKKNRLDASAIAAWVLTGKGAPPFARPALPAEVVAEVEENRQRWAARIQALYKKAAELNVQTPWLAVRQLAELGERFAKAGDVAGEESVRETASILLNLHARVRVAEDTSPAARRWLDSEMLKTELNRTPTHLEPDAP